MNTDDIKQKAKYLFQECQSLELRAKRLEEDLGRMRNQNPKAGAMLDSAERRLITFGDSLDRIRALLDAF